jgi:hypothetical protein
VPLTSPSALGGGRPGLLRQQLPYLRRAVRWQPIIGAAAVAGLLTRTDTFPILVVAVVAMGLSYVLDDPAAVILDATPTGRAGRRIPCLGLTVALAAAVWLGVVQPLWSLRSSSPAAGPADLAVATLAGVVLAAAVVGGGVTAAPVVLAVGLVGSNLPAPWSLPVVPGQSRNWVIVLAVSLAMVITGSRDPAVRRIRHKAVLTHRRRWCRRDVRPGGGSR